MLQLTKNSQIAAILFAAIAWALPAPQLFAQANPPPAAPAAAPANPQTPVYTQTDPFTSVAPARAAAAGARIRLDNTREDLFDFVRIQRTLFENSANYTQAVEDRQRAHDQFTVARAAAMEALDSDPETRQTRLLIADTSRQIERHRARVAARPPLAPSPTADRVAAEDRAQLEALVAYRLSLSQRLASLESAALVADKSVQESRAAMASANARIEALRRDFELRLRTGEDLAAARKTLRNAREDSAAATVYAIETARTADILLDYAYYVQWISLRRPVVFNSSVLTWGFPTIPFSSSSVVVPAQSSGIGFGNIPYQGQ